MELGFNSIKELGVFTGEKPLLITLTETQIEANQLLVAEVVNKGFQIQKR
jgi:hypothetical protein